jgi:hypothetical protein
MKSLLLAAAVDATLCRTSAAVNSRIAAREALRATAMLDAYAAAR